MRARLAIAIAGLSTGACELVFRPSGTPTIVDADPLAPDAGVDADPDAPDADPNAPDAPIDAEPPPDACPSATCYENGGTASAAPCLSVPANYCGLAALDELDGFDICACSEPALFVVDYPDDPDLAIVLPINQPFRLTVNGGGCTMPPFGCALSFDGNCQSEALLLWSNVELIPGSNDIKLYDEVDDDCTNNVIYNFTFNGS